ncbi:hypothetical protein NIES3787_29780 [Microcystis aeruginosa NIES-3787]|uniref:Uncharacterized protein n=1 Tax=Microcystis aeruginosa NIES-3787 TaxID=2517782 RepID=A0A6H9GMB4_MICAE|nr:hypothetical protein NIES3787_29780 [Microcystis aeruginosa NIES-3787]
MCATIRLELMTHRAGALWIPRINLELTSIFSALA